MKSSKKKATKSAPKTKSVAKKKAAAKKKASSKRVTKKPVASLAKIKSSGTKLITPKEKAPNMEVVSKRYSDEQLNEFRDHIDVKISAAEKEIRALRAQLEDVRDDEQPDDFSGGEFIASQIDRYHKSLERLGLAKARIANKTYGICIVTGDLIPKERLLVVPDAMTVINAVKVLEEREKISNSSSNFENFEDEEKVA